MFPAVAFGSHYTAQSFVLAWGLLNTLWTVYLCLKIVLATLKSCLFVYEFKSCEFMYSVSHVWQHCTCSVTSWNSPGDNWQGGLPALSNFIYADRKDAVLFWATADKHIQLFVFWLMIQWKLFESICSEWSALLKLKFTWRVMFGEF